MPVVIRPATEADQGSIRSLVYKAALNPLRLNWPHFIVAEDGGQVVGIGQVKPHGDGSRELASIAVLPAYQRQGLAGRVIEALLAREVGVLYLMCREEMALFYDRFGFREIAAAELPVAMRRFFRMGQVSARLLGLITRRKERLVAMRREPEAVSAKGVR